VLEWPDSVERVAAIVRERGADVRLEEFSEATPTAAAAARAIGCEPSEIVKSILFICDGKPVLALVPGDCRADAAKVASASGAGYARIAKADEVVAATGFEPGAVAPFPAPHVDRVDRSRVGSPHGRARADGSAAAGGRAPGRSRGSVIPVRFLQAVRRPRRPRCRRQARSG
jgi:prolyl-tRNA editing enzyme YbaK/EbsC (Cys-tRNA(Pro) deacylase)